MKKMMHEVYPKAVARLRGGREYPQLRGMVRFFQAKDGVMVEAEVCGLPKSETGFFAFHVHEGGRCAGEGFPNTGGHFDPYKTAHPKHAGDLPPLLSNHGKAYIKVFTDRFCLDEIIGRTVIIHSDPDDFHTQPSGNAGTKIACGVVQKV